MSSTTLEIVFEGPGVREGTIDAHLLAESLIGYSELFKRTNRIVNGEVSEASVLVHANFKRNSFHADLEFIQNIIEQAHRLLAPGQVLSAAGLAALLGLLWQNRGDVKDTLIDLYKWLKGKKPEKAVQVGNNYELTLGQNKRTVNHYVYHLYGDSAVKTAVTQLTNPLRQGAIDRISIRKDGEEQTAIEKSETSYFEPDPIQLDLESMPMEGERDTVLVVSKLSFTEGTTWTFFERGATVVAKILDQDFWQRVHQHQVTFGEGDMLRVRLSWKIEKQRKLIQKNTIPRVYEVFPRPKQMRLDGGEDDEMK